MRCCAPPNFILIIATVATLCSAKYIPFLNPGFFFDYNIPGQPVPIPITTQCETIHIEWSRSSAQGPNPTAPYFLQVYTSTFITPFVIPAGSGLTFDWDVPFAPGTLYQICMFDTNGVSGGCQAMYTVIQNTTVDIPTCQNITFPPLLDVVGTVPGGSLSQYGFIDQCTDLSVTPKNGKPPFILTVAPSLHPAYNITSNSMDAITWTVSLSWAFPFYLSLVSSDGLMWANGPMHAGGFGPSDCLSPGTVPASKARAVALGAGLGTLVAGILLGTLGAFVFWRDRRKSKDIFSRDKPPQTFSSSANDGDHPLPPIPSHATSNQIEQGFASRTGRRIFGRPQSAVVEPYHFSYQGQGSSDQERKRSDGLVSPVEPPFSPSTSTGTTLGGFLPSRSRTYVLHHDAGQAPVTLYTEHDSDVVELPPEYRKATLPGLPKSGQALRLAST